MPRAKKYALIQNELLFLALYVAAFYLLATNVSWGFAVVTFGGGLAVIAVAGVVGIRRGRRERR